MDKLTISFSDLLTVFGYFIAAILGLCGVIGWFFQNLHNQLKISIDSIHNDLKPLVVKVAVHEEKIIELKNELGEQQKWLNNHDTRLQGLERKVLKPS